MIHLFFLKIYKCLESGSGNARAGLCAVDNSG